MAEQKQLKCVWDMGTKCSKDVSIVEFFVREENGVKKGKVKIPVCGHHVEEHKIVMVLHKNGYDVEEILQKDANYRKEQYLILKLSGLDDSAVDL